MRPLVALVLWFAAGVAAAEPPLVSAVEVRSDLDPARVSELLALVALEPGEPFSDDRVRRTLRNVQASGWVAEAAVYSQPDPEAPGEKVAIVALWSNLVVARIELAGTLALPEPRLRGAIEQRIGVPLSEDKVERGRVALERLFHESGYYDAVVASATSAADANHQTVLTYTCTPGERWTVGAIRFSGDLDPFTSEALAAALEAKPGQPFNERLLEDGAERLRAWLAGQGYRAARLGRTSAEKVAERRQVDLAFGLEVGPKVDVVVEGAKLAELTGKGLLSFLDEEGYDTALLPRARERIRSHYQRKGHYLVKVELVETLEPGRVRIELTIVPGPVFDLAAIRFSGNDAVPGAELEALLASQPRQRWLPGSGRLVDAVLAADLANLRSFYALEGFHQARVGEPQLSFAGERIELEIPIVEGPQQRVARLEVAPGAPPQVAAWLSTAPLAAGGPYHARRLEDTVDGLRSRLADEGFAWVQIEPTLSWVDERLVDVMLTVETGPLMRLDRLILKGNLATRGEVIRRFVDLPAGAPVSRSRLLEVERRLARLGLFSRVDVRMAPGDVGSDRRDVVVEVEEGRARRLSYGLGYDSDDGARGLLGYSHRNLWGRGISLDLDARASGKDERYRLIINQPYVGAWNLPVAYSLFRFDEERESFEQQSLGLRLDGRRVSGSTRLALAFDFRVIELTDVEESLDQIDPQDREIQISSLIPSWLLDHRDDPFDPTRGWSSALELQYAFPTVSTDAHFLKLFVQQTGYLDLGRPGVLAASLRVGAIEPLAEKIETPPAGGATDNPVPIGERFFAGGRTSHRAYPRDLLGIDGETRFVTRDPDSGEALLKPLGGNGLFLANLEYRFPVIGTLGGTLFVDAGNVWRDWRDFDAGQIRLGAGLGLRYRSPIGPVRLEVGFNLDRESIEDSAEFHLTFGNPF